LEVRSSSGIRLVQPVSIQAASPRAERKSHERQASDDLHFFVRSGLDLAQAQTATDDPMFY